MNRIKHRISVDEARKILGVETDADLARKLGITPQRVAQYRQRKTPEFPAGYMDGDRIESCQARQL